MLLPIVFFLWVVCGALGNLDDKKYILVHPSNMTVKVNSTIILKCQVKPVKGMTVQWIKDGFGFSTTKADLRDYSKHLGDVDKVTLPNPSEKGYYDLKITKVNVKDEGIYICQFFVGSGHVLSWPAKVMVIAHSEAPQLLQLGPDSGPMSQPPPIVLQSSLVPVQQRKQGQDTAVAAASIAAVNNGVGLVLQCSALAGRPGARLVWSMDGYPLRPVPASDSSRLPLFIPLTDKDGPRPTGACNRRERWWRFRGGPNNLIEGTIFETCRRNHTFSRVFDSYSILRAQVNHIFNGKVIRCTAVNRGYENFNLPPAEIQVEILIRPQVRMEVMPQRQTKEYIENSWVTFVCTAKGRPNKFTWSWFVNENAVPEPPKSDTYKMQVTRSLHKAAIKCVARNHKEGHASTVINVKYAPHFRETDKTIFPADVGDDVNMSCQADSNPRASIYWQRESSNEMLGHNQILYKKNVQELDFGVYVCTAKADGFHPIIRKIYLAKKSRPVIMDSPDRNVASGSKSTQVRCIIHAIPLPKSNQIAWSFQGRQLFESNKYSIFDERVFGETTSILQINSVESADIGDYNCSVTTKIGSDWKMIKLTNNNPMPMILIVGGTVFVTMAMLIIIIVICVCKRGLWGRKYQKGHNSMAPLPAPAHSNTNTVTTHNTDGAKQLDIDYHCQPNLFQWFPLGSQQQQQVGGGNLQHKSSFVRYGAGQDVDDKSSIRNGSITQYQRGGGGGGGGVDLCSTYTSSIPGSNNGDHNGKAATSALRNPDLDEMYINDSFGVGQAGQMMCSMHHSPGHPPSSPCQHYMPISSSGGVVPPPQQYGANFLLPTYPVHMPPHPHHLPGDMGTLPPSLPPLDLMAPPLHEQQLHQQPSDLPPYNPHNLMSASQHHHYFLAGTASKPGLTTASSSVAVMASPTKYGNGTRTLDRREPLSISSFTSDHSTNI